MTPDTELEGYLRAVLTTLEPDRVYATKDVVALLQDAGVDLSDKGSFQAVVKLGDRLGWCEKGEGRPGKSFMAGKTVYPRLWRRRVPGRAIVHTDDIPLDYQAEIAQLTARVQRLEAMFNLRE